MKVDRGLSAMCVKIVSPFSVAPIGRAAATSAVLMGCGDLMCQAIQQRNKGRIKFNWKRSQRFALVGLTLHGPFFYFEFCGLDYFMGASKTLGCALRKTFVCQFMLFPGYLSAFFMYMGLLEQKTIDQCFEKITNAFIPTMISGSVFWPIVSTFNFMYVPLRFRIAYINVLGLIWNSYLSWSNSRYGEPVSQLQ